MKIIYTLGLTSLLLLLLLSGCGGGKDKPSSPNKITLKGVVQKGLFTQLAVAAYPVDETTGALGDPVETTSTSSNYELTLSTQGYYQLQATGTFINEVNGESTQLDEPLLSVIEVSGSTQDSNINLYTTMAAEQVVSRVDAGATLAEAVTDANDFVRQTVGLDSTVDFAALDITAISTDTTADNPNLQLLLFSASVLQNASNAQATEPQVLGEVIAGFGLYTTPNEAAVGLSVLGGANAASLYDIIQPNLNDIPLTLPALDTGSAVFVCNTRCDWQLELKPMLSISATQILESVGKVKLTLSLTRAIETDVQVQLSSADLTAIKGIDYRPVNRRVIIPANQLSVDVLVDLIIDGSDESVESVRYEISGVGNKYLLAQAFRDVRIYDGYGLAENVTSDPVAISSVCLSAIGDGLNIQSNGCLADAPTSLPTNETAAIAIDLSLQYPCTALNNNCNEPELRDWLVELTLESFSLVHETVQANQPLGFYLFPGEKVHPSFSSAVIETLYLHLNPAALEFLNTAKNEKFALRIRAKLTETAQQLSSTTTIEQPLLLPEKIIAGDRELDYILNSAYQIEGCEGSRYIVDANFSLDGVVYLSKKLCINTLEDSEGNIQGYLEADQQLDLAGSKIVLPDFHSSHVVYDDNSGNRLQMLGANYLLVPSVDDNGAAIQNLCDDINCYQGQGLSQGSLIKDLSVYLHAEGLPFAFKITSGYLDNTGIHLNYSARKYLQSGEYSSFDLRTKDVPSAFDVYSQNALESNDIFYKKSVSQGGLISLKTTGINTPVSVAAGTGVYAFPQAAVEWQSFSFNIEDSQISGLNTVPLTFTLQQTPRCKGCDAATNVAYVLQGDLSIDANGIALGEFVSQVNTVPTWGQVAGKKAFQRNGDLPVGASAMVSLPGYIFALPEAASIDTLLLSHVEKNANGLTRNSLTSATTIEGNEWPVGITLGPQTYFIAGDDPSAGTGRMLNNTNLTIYNGVDTYNKPVNVGVKYVVRNSGITGVFNLDINPLVGDNMVMFGYDMQFSRFAFRLTDNTLDEYSWIDGLIRLPGDANFDTQFTSLSMACDAKFGRGMVTYCDTTDCQQKLKAWNANTDIINMQFVGAGGVETQACIVENQQLSLEQTVEMFALTDRNGELKPAGVIDALWSPDGILNSNRLAPLQNMILDAKDLKRGFAIAPQAGELQRLTIDNVSYGVLNLNNTELVASQFWDTMQTDIRLANLASSAESSVVVAAGKLSSIDKQKNEALADNIISNDSYKGFSPDARFSWNNSSFGFSLPVYYATGLNEEQASFFGRRKKSDLLIMQADAGIDYIQPRRTHLSFGASANIPQLGSLPLRVDISDLNSLKKVDGLLSDLNISLNLEQTFTNNFPLQPYIDSILKMGNNGLSIAIEETLDEILTRSASVTIDGRAVNLWEEIAEPVVALQSVPLQLDAVFDAGVSQTFESGVYEKSLRLRTEFEALSIALDSVSDISIRNRQVAMTLVVQLERIRSALRDIKDANARVVADINSARDQALELVNTVDGRIKQQIDRLKNAIEKVSGTGNGILQQAIKINELTACRSGDLTVDKADFLKPNIQLINDVANAIDLLSGGGGKLSDFIGIMSVLYTDESELMQQFRQRVESEQLDIKLAKSDFTEGVSELYGAICNNSENDYLEQALADFVGLNDQVSAIIIALEQVKNTLLDKANKAIALTNIATDYMESLDAILGDVEQQLANPISDYNISVLRDQINAAIPEISSPLESGGATASIRIDKLFATENSGQLDFHSGVIQPLYLQLELIPKTIRDLMTPFTLSGAYFSADEYKAMVIDRIMNSQGVASLRIDVNQFLQSYIDKVINVQLIIGDQINLGIKTQLAKIASPLNDLIAEATAELPLPIKAAEIDGFAVIQNSQLTQLHIAASFETPGQSDGEKGNKFKGSFDAYRQSSRDDTQNCGTGGLDTFTAEITAMGPITIGESDSVTASINLKFILNEDASGVSAYLPVGLNGGISIQGEMDYDPFILRDFGFQAGLGLDEVYLGAGGVGSFDTTELGLYAFAGRTCDATVITKVDSQIADFITIDESPFTGIYGRGKATIPIYDVGCLLSVDASATIGSWVTVEPVFEIGGIIGGGAMGELACIGSIRGEVMAVASVNSRKEVFFAGKAFAVAGIGDCDVGTWTSRSRSRKDSWCGTADVEIGVKYEDGSWEYDPQTPSAVH